VKSELITRSNEPNLVTALAAKAPNVQVNASSGDPGASSRIQIRGLRTLIGNIEPLFVIDGVPVTNYTFSTTNLNPVDAGGTGVGGQDNGGQGEGTSAPNRMFDINPDDIENVEILKGAAAAAIYGARAANGVILITTKHGRAGETKVTFRSQGSFDDITRVYPLQRSFGLGDQNSSPPSACEDISASICLRSWGPRLSGVPTYDHATEAFRTGHLVDNTLNFSGGTDRTTFFLSGGYMHQDGIFVGPNNFYNRATGRLNGSHKLGDNLTLNGNVMYADSRGHTIQRGNNVNGLLLGLFRTPPEFNNLPYLDPKTGLHRSYRLQNPTIASQGQSRGFNNPFFSLNEELNNQQTARSLGNIAVDYQALKWLKFNYSIGADYSNDERLEGCPQECSDVAASGRITEGKIVNYQIDHNLTGTANWSISDGLKGTFTAGQNLNSRNFRVLSQVGRTLIAPAPFSILNTLQRDPPSDYQTQVHQESYFGQATVDVANQLFLTGALRDDGSTTYSENNRRALFPKASAAWTWTQVYKPSFITFGKLRASYGEAGNEPLPYLTSITFSGSNLLGGVAQGTGFTPTQSGLGGLIYTTTRPSTDLKTERTKEIEAGFDVGVFREKADLSFTVYHSRTEDAILPIPNSPSSGYAREYRNGGTLTNRGLEVTLNLRPLAQRDAAWEVGLTWGRNRSKLVSLEGAEFLSVPGTFLSGSGNVFMVGQPLGVIRSEGFVRCGVSPDDAVEGLNLTQACAGAPTGALYIDDGKHCNVNNAGMPCEDTQLRILGDPNPKWTGGVTSTLRFKRLTLGTQVDVRHGGVVWNGTKSALYSYGTHGDTQGRAVCTGTTSNTCTGNEKVFGSADWFPGAVAGPGVGTAVPIGQNWYRNGLAPCAFTGVDEPCLEDGGFVKLRELSAAYTFSARYVRRALGVSTFDLRLAARNLHTWTKYTGLDPETDIAQANARVLGADYFNLPMTRSFVITLTLNR
jgi:TonB-linked SusC/RagA family outer membrane protein